MAKKEINYSDLSTKELELLKDIYVDQKVKSMNNSDLKDFVIENISLQIKSTIGNDEELEAWREMGEFFKDEFEKTIENVKTKVSSKKSDPTNLNIKVTQIDTDKKVEDQKLDMWED